MSTNLRTAGLPPIRRILGTALQPLIVSVAGSNRAALEHVEELAGPAAYIGLFSPTGSAVTE